MRHIDIKISYDGVKSRLPGVIPSIVDSWSIPPLYNCGIKEDGETFYSYPAAVRRAYDYNINAAELVYNADFISFDKDNLLQFAVGNYGLIPSDIIIPKDIADTVTDYTDIYVNIPDGNGGYYDLSHPENDDDPHYEGRNIVSGGTVVKILTYATLNKWYVFFKEYYNMIERPEYARTYSSATDYYETEFKVKNEDLERYYEELDNTFNSRGGKEMYEWICNNCIIQYNIPKEFVDEWNATYLYLPDAVKWYWWFEQRYEKYKMVYNLEDCPDTDTCCDCTEYIRLGGNDFFAGKDRESGLRAWVEKIMDKFDTSYATMSASVTVPVNITNSIDDLGEMAILSSEWQEEVDYHNTLEEKGYEMLPFEEGGTVVHNAYTYDESGNTKPLPDTYMIVNGEQHKGYFHNEFHENVFKEDDWMSYTEYYIDRHKEEFAANACKDGKFIELTGYTFSPINGKVIYNPTDDDVKQEIDAVITPCTCINGETYEVIKGKYVELCYNTNNFASLKYKKHTKLQIFKDGDLEYAVMNGKRKYVTLDNNGVERIYFLKEANCYDNGCVVQEGQYIVFDSCLYFVNTGLITIHDDESQRVYPVVDGYFDLEGNRFYISDNEIVLPEGYDYDDENDIYMFSFREVTDDDLRLFGIKSAILNDNKVILYYDYTVTTCLLITGHTDSKLEMLRRKKITTDDLGNELPGHFKSIVDVNKGEGQSIYNLPYDQCTLDILYRTGEVSGIYPNKDISDGNYNYFDGNIITDIRFYYTDELGNPVIVEEANDDNALDAIDACNARLEESEDDTIDGTLYCEITYHIGTVLRKNGDRYEIPMNENSKPTYHTGVKYVDRVKVSEEVGTYYMDNGDSFTFSYYLLTPHVGSVDITDFNTSVTCDMSTTFEMVPRLYYILVEPDTTIPCTNKYEDFTLSQHGDETFYSGWSENNNIIAAPLFRNEFNLASSLPQIIDADIYIDRGISAAFEKHLKLQEIRTMEALENLGNNYFKINKY